MAMHLFSLSRFFALFAVFILIGAATDAVCEYLTLVPPPYAPSSNLATKPLIVDSALYWHIQPLNSTGHPIPGLLVNQPCTILIKIINIEGIQEKVMEQLHYQGMHPDLYTVMEDSMAEPFGPVSWDENRLAWVSSIRTNPSPGWISFYISSASRISTLSQAVKSTLVTVAASSLLENYQSLLPFMATSLKAQAKRPLTSSFVPMLTPISFIVLDEPNTFIISYDQHQSSQIVTLQKGWKIEGSDSVRIRNMIFFSQHIIMQTEEAIYSGILDQGKINWREQLRMKISAIRSSSILLPYSTPSWSEATFAFSSFPPRIFCNFGPSDDAFHELKSAGQVSLAEFLNGNYEIVDVAYTASSPTNVPILVKNKDSNLYSYIQYHLVDDSQNALAFSSGKWELLYRLPARIPIVTGSKHGSAVPLYRTGFSETKQLELSSLSILSTLSQYVYLWGNALIFSPDHGNTFYTIHSTPDLRITQFSSNNRGAFVFISNNQEVWYGQVGSIVSRVLPWTVEAPLLPFFDSVGDLKFYLLLTGDSPTLQEEVLLVTFLSEFLIDEQSEGEEVSCPIKEISFSADFSTALTRAPAVPTGLKDLEKSYIPSTLFFDLNYRYEFDIFLTPNKNLLPTDVGISFQLEQSTPYISLASSRREISGGRLQYHVYLQESGEYDGMYEPGTNLAPSSLIILVDNATFSCQNERAPTQLKSSTYYEIPLFTGCPPSQRLEYSHQKSIERDQGCDSWDGIPCLYFDFTFAPVFELIDEVTGAITDYSGYYIFEIVGAGGDLDSIEMFDEDKLVLYNNGTSRIWSPLQPALDDQRVLITKEGRNEIIWACSPGSPCYDVLPRFPNTPYYYFVIQISTKGMNNGNYCDYRKRMTLRVHGIPMTMEWTVGLTFSSVGFFIFLFVMRFLIKSRIPESRVSRVPR